MYTAHGAARRVGVGRKHLSRGNCAPYSRPADPPRAQREIRAARHLRPLAPLRRPQRPRCRSPRPSLKTQVSAQHLRWSRSPRPERLAAALRHSHALATCSM
eukprot:scaffold7911_cov152-Isochrysis_galbana.AAC.3